MKGRQALIDQQSSLEKIFASDSGDLNTKIALILAKKVGWTVSYQGNSNGFEYKVKTSVGTAAEGLGGD